MVFVFYQFNAPPLFFNEPELAARGRRRRAAPSCARSKPAPRGAFERKRAAVEALARRARRPRDAGRDRRRRTRVPGTQPPTPTGRARAGARAGRAGAARGAETKRRRLRLPLVRAGATSRAALIGLLLAVILCAAMSLDRQRAHRPGRRTVVDFYRRSWRPNATDAHYVRVARLATVALGRAGGRVRGLGASLVDNLIQAVNILGLAVLRHDPGRLPGRVLRRAGCAPRPVFVAALISEALVDRRCWLTTDIGFLWFNVIGCAAVLLLSAALTASGLGARE